MERWKRTEYRRNLRISLYPVCLKMHYVYILIMTTNEKGELDTALGLKIDF